MVRRPARLSAEERKRILSAVTAAEKRTSAEFVLVVAKSSDAYAMYPLAWAGALSLVLGGVLALALPGLSLRAAFAAQGGCFIALGLLLHWLPLRLLLVPAKLKRKEAEELARVEFAKLVLGRTHGGVGLLLFASLGERFVEIIPDQGIAMRLPESHWRAVVDEFVAKLAAGRTAEGFIGAVESCTRVLEKQFPYRSHVAAELPDAIVEIEQ
jgi:putative membrane protein